MAIVIIIIIITTVFIVTITIILTMITLITVFSVCMCIELATRRPFSCHVCGFSLNRGNRGTVSTVVLRIGTGCQQASYGLGTSFPKQPCSLHVRVACPSAEALHTGS